MFKITHYQILHEDGKYIAWVNHRFIGEVSAIQAQWIERAATADAQPNPGIQATGATAPAENQPADGPRA